MEDAYGHKKLGGIGQIISEELKKRTGQNTMVQQVGYLMRSGPPDALDTMVAMSFGQLAMQCVLKGESGRNGRFTGREIYTTVPVDTVMKGARKVDVENFYDAENYRPRIKDVMGVPMFLR